VKTRASLRRKVSRKTKTHKPKNIIQLTIFDKGTLKRLYRLGNKPIDELLAW